MIRCVAVASTSADELVVPVDAMKKWLRIDGDESAEDDVVRSLLGAATERIEDCSARSFIKKTFDAILDAAPRSDQLRLPRAPLASVVSVKGFTGADLTDTGGTAMSSSGYYVDTASEPGRVVLTGSGTWPTATRAANALIVRFVAGESTSASGVQERAKTEIKQLVARLFEHRGDELEQAKILAEYETAPNDLSLPEWG